VTVVRVEKVHADPSRTTEVVSVVSDGKNLTSGTREQTDFRAPVLESPDGIQVSDEATIKRVAGLIAAVGKNRLLLKRPDGPDAAADPDKRPFNAPGTYVLFNASSPLDAQVVVQCAGQEQRWSFKGESNPSVGQVNCAVEPSKANATARLVFTDNC
jgi:hypothetical protein